VKAPELSNVKLVLASITQWKMGVKSRSGLARVRPGFVH
jgi:hypothetical protein